MNSENYVGLTIKECIEKISIAKEISQTEEVLMQNILRETLNMPKARVVCGLVYVFGTGQPFPIQEVAKSTLEALKQMDVKQ